MPQPSGPYPKEERTITVYCMGRGNSELVFVFWTTTKTSAWQRFCRFTYLTAILCRGPRIGSARKCHLFNIGLRTVCCPTSRHTFFERLYHLWIFLFNHIHKWLLKSLQDLLEVNQYLDFVFNGHIRKRVCLTNIPKILGNPKRLSNNTRNFEDGKKAY